MLAMNRIEARRRFIEEKQRWIVHERATECEQLAHPAGQTTRSGVALFLQISQVQQVCNTLVQLRHRDAAGAAEKPKILLHREIGIQTKALGDVAKLRPHLLSFLPYVMAGNARFTAAGMSEAAQHPNGGGFPRSICPEESEYCSRRDAERDFPDRLNIAETLAQPVEHDHGFVHFRKVIAMAEQHLQPGNVPLEVCK